MSLLDRVAGALGYEPRSDESPLHPVLSQYDGRVDPWAEVEERHDSFTPTQVDLSGFLDEGRGVGRLPHAVADYLYERTWLSVVVDIIPEWGTKAGFTIPALDGKTQEGLFSDLEDLQATEEIKRAWRFSRQHGGAGLIKIVDDGRPSHLPIDRDNIRKVIALAAKDRHELTVLEWGTDGRRLGPRMYQDENGNDWHPSRVVPFVNRPLSDRRREWYDYWSVSELERVFEAFVRDEQAFAALSKIVKEYSYDVLHLKDLDMKNKNDVRDALKAIALSIKKIGKFALGSEDKFTSHSKTMTGLPDSVSLLAEKASQITRIPVSILLFKSPGGLNTGANAGDWEALFGHVESEQTVHYVPAVASLTADILASRTGPTGGRQPERWKVVPRPIAQVAPKDQAEIEKLEAERRALDLTAGVVSTDEVRREGGVVELYGVVEDVAAPDAPDVDVDPGTGGDPGSVEETALNGAQMKAMVEIAMQVQAGTLSREAAIGILVLSFPSIPEERIARAIPEVTEPAAPAEGATDAGEEGGAEPAPSPGRPPEGARLVSPKDLKERYGIGYKALMTLIRSEKVRAWKPGGRWRLLEDEIAEAILHHQPAAE